MLEHTPPRTEKSYEVRPIFPSQGIIFLEAFLYFIIPNVALVRKIGQMSLPLCVVQILTPVRVLLHYSCRVQSWVHQFLPTSQKHANRWRSYTKSLLGVNEYVKVCVWMMSCLCFFFFYIQHDQPFVRKIIQTLYAAFVCIAPIQPWHFFELYKVLFIIMNGNIA